MFAKKAVLALSAGALLGATVPAFADHDSWRHRQGTYDRAAVEQYPPAVGYRVVRDRPVVAERPVYREPVYERQPARDYGRWDHRYEQPVYGHGQAVYSEPAYAPAPVYAERDNTMATIGGAAIGAFIGSQIGQGPNRAAASAVGALLGGILGSNF